MPTSELFELRIKLSHDEARLERLRGQENHLVLKQDKRLQILIGTAILAELQELISTDHEAYHLKVSQLKKALTANTPRQRDKEFLAEFNLLDDTIISL